MYKDDRPFWFGLIESGGQYRVVYRMSSCCSPQLIVGRSFVEWFVFLGWPIMKYDCFGWAPHPETIFEGMYPKAPKLPDYELEFHVADGE